jgi:membrane-bound lytic murein transglycosylase D
MLRAWRNIADKNNHQSARLLFHLIFLTCFLFTSINSFSFPSNNKYPIADTSNLPVKDFNQFGFKNLFTEFSYNPSIPYNKQVNPNAELFMRDYLTAHRNELIKLKKTGAIYFDMIDQVLSQYKLPHELKYLAVIESHLKTGATSWVGAAGPWQFMPETAKRYGLIVNAERDDRRDFFLSTHAAAKMLEDLFSTYQDWLLVIAAYNGGPGRVDEAIRKSKSRDFWKLQHYLPEESRNHVKKFIATHYVMESGKVVFDFEKNKTPQKNDINRTSGLKSEKIKGKYLSHIIVQELRINKSIFEQLNPDFDKAIRLTNEYLLTLPEDIMYCFLESRENIMKKCINWLMNQN